MAPLLLSQWVGWALPTLTVQKNGNIYDRFYKSYLSYYPGYRAISGLDIYTLGRVNSRIILLMLIEKWWSCIFGLMNTISILIGMVLYGINTISLLFNLI
jgi:hypothetical protein